MSKSSSTTDRSPRTRRLLIGGALLAVVVAAVALASVVLIVRASDRSTPVDVGEVVSRYQAASPGPATSAYGGDRSIPAPGVYLYGTSGGESVDALGGLDHDYPAVTTITIAPSECGGVVSRWDVFEQRWDEQSTCRTDVGLETRWFGTHHEFFGRPDERTYTFESPSPAVPANLDPGSTWTTIGRSPDTTLDGEGRVVGPERLAVGSASVETVHLRVTTRQKGATDGTSVRDTWVDAETGLVVRQIVQADTRSDSPLGSVAYREQYEIRLQALAPQR